MKRHIALGIAVVLLLAAAPRSGQAGADAAPTAKTCFFVRNNLPCPCPRAQQARAVMHAARFTFGALGNAIGTTAAALSRADRAHAASAGSRNASAPAKR